MQDHNLRGLCEYWPLTPSRKRRRTCEGQWTWKSRNREFAIYSERTVLASDFVLEEPQVDAELTIDSWRVAVTTIETPALLPDSGSISPTPASRSASPPYDHSAQDSSTLSTSSLPERYPDLKDILERRQAEAKQQEHNVKQAQTRKQDADKDVAEIIKLAIKSNRNTQEEIRLREELEACRVVQRDQDERFRHIAREEEAVVKVTAPTSLSHNSLGAQGDSVPLFSQHSALSIHTNVAAGAWAADLDAGMIKMARAVQRFDRLAWCGHR